MATSTAELEARIARLALHLKNLHALSATATGEELESLREQVDSALQILDALTERVTELEKQRQQVRFVGGGMGPAGPPGPPGPPGGSTTGFSYFPTGWGG